MTNWPQLPRDVPPARPPRRPPGRLFTGTALALLGSTVWLTSERGGSRDVAELIAAGWCLVMVGWLIRFIAGTTSGPLVGRGAVARSRWLVTPAAFVFAGWLAVTDWTLGARLALSEEPLDRAAEAALAGFPPMERGWIGLYPVELVTVDGASVRFEIVGQGALVRDAPATSDLVQVYGRWSIEDGWAYPD
jgi:hypothetical protein